MNFDDVPITREEVEETAKEFGLTVEEMHWMIKAIDSFCKNRNFPLKKLPHSPELNWFIGGFVSAVAFRIHTDQKKN